MDASEQLPGPSAGATPELAPDRVLVLSDQPVLVEAVTHALDHTPVALRQARDVSEASTALPSLHPRLALVDMSLDDGQILEQLAVALGPNARLPVLALIRRGELQGWLSAIQRGADDFVPIPFSAEEMVARVLPLLKRVYDRPVTYSSIIRVGGLEIDVLHRRVRLDDVELQLTPVEESLLYLLVANAGRVLTRDQILNTVWGRNYMTSSNIVDQHIYSLRRKLAAHWQRPQRIETVPGRGYRFLSSDLPQQAPTLDDPALHTLVVRGAGPAAYQRSAGQDRRPRSTLSNTAPTDS
jgi:DNA-binding response OmpR family regulator